jgi:L-asparagine transporter-like permease
MLDWFKKNPIYTSIGVTFVVSLIMIISSSITLSKYSKESAPKSAKAMQTFGYILMAILVIAFIFTMCSQRGADCTTPFLIFSLWR